MFNGPVTDEKNFTITAQHLTITVFLYLKKKYTYLRSNARIECRTIRRR